MKLNIIRKSLLALIAFILTTTSAHSQVVEPGDITPLSPQVWNFMKYGNTSVDLNTGTIFESIPIYTYKDKDFEIPISVDYASNGYTPNVQTGILGLGWSLNAGGCITREVRGLPDEDVTGLGSTRVLGYLHYHKDIQNNLNYNWMEICQYNYNYSHPNLIFPKSNINNAGYEVNPDIFTFNFGKHRGSFILGPAGQVYIYNKSIPTCNYKINIDAVHNNNTTGKNTLLISITTSDGYKFSFGWQNSMTDITLRNPGPTNKMPLNLFNNTFFLKEIQAPNGRKVTYDYFGRKNERDSLYNHIYKPTLFKQTLYLNNEIKEDFNLSSSKKINIESNTEYRQYAVNLKKIIVDGKLSINFTYSHKMPELKLIQQGLTDTLENQEILKSIQIYNEKTHQQIENSEFNYYVNKRENNLTFLKSVNVNNYRKFTFNYNKETDGIFPKHGTCAIDHWGYYNGKYIIGNLDDINNLNIQTKLTNHTHREPNTAAAMMGMLTQITYPTGGYSRFEYEGNTHSSVLRNNTATDGNFKLFRETGNSAGIRVKKILNYNFDNKCLGSKEYTYNSPQGGSSGILLFKPTYNSTQQAIYIIDGYNLGLTLNTISGNDTYGTQLNKQITEYQYVREKNINGSYIDYEFSCYNNTPDDISKYTLSNIRWEGIECTLGDPIKDPNLFRKPISYQSRRGKLLEVKRYDASNPQKMVEKNNYTYNAIADNKFSETLESALGFLYLHKTLVSDSYLSEEKNVVYTGANNLDSIVTKTTYEYNFRSQLIKTTTVDRNNDGPINSTVYVGPTASQADKIGLFMLENNMVDYPFMTYAADSKTGIIIAGKSYDYLIKSGVNPMLKLSSINTLVSANQSSPFQSTFETDIVFNQYDNMGNLLQSKTRDGLVTSYIWGHGGMHLVAEVKNTAIAQINTLIEFRSITSSPLANALNPDQIKKIREIPNALATIYTYKPFVGVTSITDPAGVSTYYSYDDNNKLKEVYIMNYGTKQLIESYNYKYYTNDWLTPIK